MRKVAKNSHLQTEVKWLRRVFINTVYSNCFKAGYLYSRNNWSLFWKGIKWLFFLSCFVFKCFISILKKRDVGMRTELFVANSVSFVFQYAWKEPQDTQKTRNTVDRTRSPVNLSVKVSWQDFCWEVGSKSKARRHYRSSVDDENINYNVCKCLQMTHIHICCQ